MYYHEMIGPSTFDSYNALISHVSQETGITEDLIKKIIPFEEAIVWRCEICISANDKGYLAYCQLRDYTYEIIRRELEDGSWESDVNLVALTLTGDEFDSSRINEVRFSLVEPITSCSVIPHFIDSLGFFENVYHCSGDITSSHYYSFKGKRYISESSNRLLFLVE